MRKDTQYTQLAVDDQDDEQDTDSKQDVQQLIQEIGVDEQPELINTLKQLDRHDTIVDVVESCVLLRNYKRKIRKKCCISLVTDLGLIGTLLYLFGSLCFSSAAFLFDDAMVKAELALIGTGFYLCGGVIFMYSACRPWCRKLNKIQALENQLKKQETRASQRINANLSVSRRRTSL